MKLFLSYSWNDDLIADEIETDLNKLGVKVIRDIRELNYKGNIKKFMKQVATTDYVVILISDSFLKSPNCMYEILELAKDESYKARTLQVILKDANIFRPLGKLEYVDYWQSEINKLKKLLKRNIVVSNQKEVRKDIKHYQSIIENIYEFISFISDEKNETFESLQKQKYKPLISYIGLDHRTINYDSITYEEPLLIDLSEFNEGDEFIGTVTRIHNYGIYIQIIKDNGFRDGLLHKSKFPNLVQFKKVKKFLEIGDKIPVRILDILPNSTAAPYGGGLGFIVQESFKGFIQSIVTRHLRNEDYFENKLLDLSGLGLINIPIEVKQYKECEELNLTLNNIRDIPDFIFQLPKLKRIYFDHFLSKKAIEANIRDEIDIVFLRKDNQRRKHAT